MTEDRVPTHRPRFDPWVGCVCGNNHRLTDAVWSEQPAPPLDADGRLIGRLWFEDWSGEKWPADLSASSQSLWEERGVRVAARLGSAPSTPAAGDD